MILARRLYYDFGGWSDLFVCQFRDRLAIHEFLTNNLFLFLIAVIRILDVIILQAIDLAVNDLDTPLELACKAEVRLTARSLFILDCYFHFLNGLLHSVDDIGLVGQLFFVLLERFIIVKLKALI